MPFVTSCPRCHGALTAAGSPVAYTIVCPHCRTPFTIHAIVAQPAEPSPQADPFETATEPDSSSSRISNRRREYSNSKSNISRTLYAILGIALGGLGIHNLAAGRYIEGILQLVFTCIAFAVCHFVVEDRIAVYERIAIEGEKRMVEIRAEQQQANLRIGLFVDLNAIGPKPGEVEKHLEQSAASARRDTRWVWLLMLPFALWILVDIIAVTRDGKGRSFN